MAVTYDQYYQTENLFGQPYKALMDFFSKYPKKGKVLDLGCGQGRDAVPLARQGFDVTGIDNSMVGIDQMNRIAKQEHLKLTGIVTDIYQFEEFANYDFILLDSMFHFTKKDIKKEIAFIQKIIANIDQGCLIIFCIQDTGVKVDTLYGAIDYNGTLQRLANKEFKYTFKDNKGGHESTTNYRLIVVQK